MRCVFLTLAEVLDFVIDDELAYEPLKALGIDVESQPWDSDVDWSQYDVAVIRSTWDYLHTPDHFADWATHVDRVGRLLNRASTVRWNLHKRYLALLADAGLPVRRVEQPAGCASRTRPAPNLSSRCDGSRCC